MQQRKQRRQARKTALQIFYSCEVGGANISDVIDGISPVPEIVELDDYSVMLLNGVPEKLEHIDKIIDQTADNWAIDRMPIVDKCLIRQTVYEMIYVDEVPISVSINEAVELAKQFCAEDDSHKFVNGVLGKIAKSI